MYSLLFEIHDFLKAKVLQNCDTGIPKTTVIIFIVVQLKKGFRFLAGNYVLKSFDH